MKKNFLAGWAIGLLMFCSTVIPTAAMADSIALSFTGGAAYGYVTEPLPNTIGWEFNLSAPVTLTALGFYDFGADGLSTAHNVAIWGTTTQNLIISTMVDSNDSIDQGFRWEAITPLTLAIGTYRIGALIDGIDNYYSGVESLTTITPVTYIGGVYSLASFQYPSSIGYTNNGRFGPNFQFQSQTSPTPEPSTMLLLGFGMLGLAGVARKKMRK